MRWLPLIGALALWLPSLPAEVVRNQVPVQRVRTMLDSVGRQCETAKTAKDLERLWTELATLTPALDSGDPDGALVRSEIAAATDFVGRWREYLEAYQAGNRHAAFDVLKNLLDEPRWLTLVPRSLVLERYREKTKYFQVRYPTDRITDIPKVIAALKELERQVDKPGGKQKQISEFEELLMIWDLRKVGNWDEMEKGCQLSPEDPSAVCRFKYLILAHAVVGYLGLEAKTKLVPEETEGAPQFLERLIAEAETNGDFIANWRWRTYRSSLDKNAAPWNSSEILAVGAYLEGQKFEADGKWFQAVTAYRYGLHRIARPAVMNASIRRLANLRKEHPEAFENQTNYDDGQFAASMTKLIWQVRGIEPPPGRESVFSPPGRPPTDEVSRPVWLKY